MKVTPITSPLPGEHLAATSPAMAPETPINWRQRLNFWAGRALTADALELEQENRAGELARRGRVVTAGIVTGLDVALEAPATPPDPLVTAGHFIHLLPGYGITVSGEDVIVPRPLRIALDQIPVHYVRYQDAGEPAPADVSATTPMEFGGVKVETDDFAGGYLPWAAVLVAQSTELGLFGNIDPTDPCELDPSADAFSDARRLDAMMLRFFQIPLEWKNDPLLTDPNDSRWRNRLAQIIFREESKSAARQYVRFRASQPEGQRWDTVLAFPGIFPWEFFGLPIALLSSEIAPGGARSLYLDRASVARPGGRVHARSRPALHLATEESDETLHPPGSGEPALWRARVDQFAEHLSRHAELAAAEMAEHFQFLPPAGLLPRSALDFLTTDDAKMLPPSSPGMPPDRAAVSHFFPAAMDVDAVPMPLEDLDAALAASAPLAPFDFQEVDGDLVRILVPIPQEVFDPHLLVVELEDPFFAAEIGRLIAARQDWRQRRDFHRTWLSALEQFISGVPPAQPTLALEPGQFEKEPVETVSELPEAAYLSPADTPGPWEISASFGGEGSDRAATPLVPATVLFIALRHDFDNPPTRVEVRWRRGNEEFVHVWAEPSQPFAERFDEAGEPLAIPLTRLYTVTASELGVTDGTLTGFTLHLEDGRAGLTVAGELRPATEGGSPVRLMSTIQQWWNAKDDTNVAFAGGNWTRVTGSQMAAPFETRSTPIFDEGEQDLTTRINGIEAALNPAKAAPWKNPNDPNSVPITVTVANDGLKKGLATLEAEANEADDFVDANFLRAQTNLYRIRKLILGETAAQKLLINPAISVIAEQQTAAASAEQLKTYLAAAKLRSVTAGDVDKAIRATRTTTPAAPKTSPLTRSAGSAAFRINPEVETAALKSTIGVSKVTIGGTAARSITTETAPLKNIFGQLPESGPILPPRGLSIGQRFTEPAATSNLSYARSALEALVEQLRNLRLPLIDQNVRSLKGTDVSLLELQGRALPSDNTTTEDKRTAARDALLATDVATDTDEAEVTLAALDMIEVKSAILRTIEAVIQQRRSLLTGGQETLAAIKASASATQSRLGTLESSLAEARHDVSVARALRQEEQERVAGINTTRDDILRDEVKFLAYVRPRAVDIVRRGVPGWKLENADAPAPVPACLRLHDQPPDALRAYVQLFQQAPVRWFPDVGPHLKLLDQRDKLVELLAATQQSARIFAAQQRVAFAQQVTHVATQNTLLAAFSRVEPSRAKAATIQIAASNTISWTTLQQQAQDNSSLGDVIGGRHGNPALAQTAATTLNQIESVATCLYAEFAAVAASTRLLWVERYSQFDRPAPLRDLTVLPSYGNLDRDTRRRFQAFVDWLFQRVNSAESDAVNLINDLVRICLLLASHAPVKSLIAGHLPRPVPVRPGVLVPLRPFDPNQVKVGMEVHVWKASTLVAQGRVEDLGDGEVSARVDKVHAATTTLDETMQVQFVPVALAVSKNVRAQVTAR